ncbi:phage baseplate assembly protein W [Chryseobacterium sp. PvR013]|uniref:GPW/gp25 family protein n=1 Tax=Chryseobacterium sp. PvR013 TaxID=2806595 RepID=UPI001AE2579C|nr:GPW/gp25 family protein [Chryseobacterium sp. PvR013]MBP1164640.1 phage baseplate assembly protein W [Chryseobacterium sp. PvR013]
MKGIYYKTPIDFASIMDERGAEKVSIDQSISQYLFIIITTPLGRCKFDDTFGTEIFEVDFDLPKSDNSIKEFIIRTVAESIIEHEHRLLLEDIEVAVKNADIGKTQKKRVKKKVMVSVKGLVKETDRPFFFQKSFFIGPLSY